MDKRDAFILALQEFKPDLIISDYYLGGFKRPRRLSKSSSIHAPDTPCRCSHRQRSTRETAVECMKRGAVDYVLKNRPPRLVAILQTTLERQRLLRENVQITREHEQLFRLTADLFCLASLDGNLQVVNPAWFLRLGFTEKELIGRPLFTLVHPDDRHALDSWWSSLVSRGQTSAPFDATPTPVSVWSASCIRRSRLPPHPLDSDARCPPRTGLNLRLRP